MTTVYNDDACIRSLSNGNGGSSEPPVVRTYTTTHQLVIEDLAVTGNVVEMSSSDEVDVIIPLDSTLLFTPANQAMFVAMGLGNVNFKGETDSVIIHSKDDFRTLNGQYAGARLYKRNEANEWGLVGDLKASVVPAFRMLAPDAASSSFTVAVEMLSGEATIDWGDGSPTESNIGGIYDPMTVLIPNAASHDYSEFVGAAEIKVSGDIKRIQIIGAGITEILDLQEYEHYMFINMSDLTTVPPVFPSTLTNAAYMFSGCSVFNQATSIDLTNATSAEYMYANCSAFNQELPTNTGNITSFLSFLNSCYSFNQPLTLDTSSATSLGSLLGYCSSFDQEVNLNLQNVNSIHGFMLGCSSFNQPVTLLNSGNVLDAESAFQNCELFNSPLIMDMKNVTNADSFLFGCTMFNQDLSGFCVTNLLTEPASFSYGSALTAPNKPIWGTCPV